MIIKAAIITENQKSILQGKRFDIDCFFNPIQDKNNNWIISYEEIQKCTNPLFWWIKDLDIIETELNTLDL
jgi:hypothetical protein